MSEIKNEELNLEALEDVSGGKISPNDKPGSPNPLPYKEGWQNYKIKSGDNLTRIANNYRTTVDYLMSGNRGVITNKNYIRAGFYMYVPA